MPDLHIQPIRALKDNYIWCMVSGTQAAVVDPGEAEPVIEELYAQGLELVAILATHHHPDHVGGVPGLLEKWKVPVYGPKHEPIPTLTNPVGGGDMVSIPELGVKFEVIDIPGHTRAHIAYYGEGRPDDQGSTAPLKIPDVSGSPSNSGLPQGVLFSGDTLFACGCGRAFEGPPEQLYQSLQRLMQLPDDTLIYCGHEYTVANIDFAQAVEPGNDALLRRRGEEVAQRAANRPTLPSTIGREKATNPFLRCTQPAVIASADKYLGKRLGAPAQVFSALREWKNNF